MLNLGIGCYINGVKMKIRMLNIATALIFCIGFVQSTRASKQSVYAYQTGDTTLPSKIAIIGPKGELSHATFEKDTRFLPGSKKAKDNKLFFDFGDAGESTNTIKYYRVQDFR
jgi:hypothetical protein